MRFASDARTVRALGLAALLLGLGAGCTQPQSGIFQSHWCHPNDADQQPYVMLDDMEDGDAAPCAGISDWAVSGSPDFGPVGDTVPETVGGRPLPVVLLDADQAALDPLFEAVGFGPTTRAHHLHGTIAAGGYGSLVLPPAIDLSAFQELDFWARTDGGAATLTIGLFTNDGRYFSEKVTIQAAWESYSAPLLGGLFAADGTPVTAADLATAAQLEFRFQGDINGNPASFGFWLDDVVVKR